jgi:hypothetical protein
VVESKLEEGRENTEFRIQNTEFRSSEFPTAGLGLR